MLLSTAIPTVIEAIVIVIISSGSLSKPIIPKIDIAAIKFGIIPITDNIGILMTYPQLDTVQRLSKGKGGEIDTMFDMVCECMYQIWEGDEIHDCMDYAPKDKKAFIESLTHEQFLKVQKFFETMPTLKHDVVIKNPNTGKFIPFGPSA